MAVTRRNVYLKKKSLEDAQEILFRTFADLAISKTEEIPVPEAVGRTLVAPVFAKLSSPAFHVSAMDGLAVRAASTFGASETRPVSLAVGTDAVPVNTGNVIPEGYDAVIMIEQVQPTADNEVTIEAPAFPWQYVRKMGEDIVATELLFAQNHIITPYCVGALLSGGVFTVTVKRRPRVLIIPTGAELIAYQQVAQRQLAPGEVLETNSFVLGSLIAACGSNYTRHAIVTDDHQSIRNSIQDALAGDFDMVLTVGGSSAGSEDHAREVIAELGEVLVHGVTIMPGKPVIIGIVKGKPVFGMPGYPVSAIIAFEQFVGPLLCHMLGTAFPDKPVAEVYPTRKIPSKLGVEEFVRVKLGTVGERIVATSLPRGAGSISTITEADGIIRIPRNSEGVESDKPVRAELLRPAALIENTIVVVGSHDNTLDILTDHIRINHPGLTLSSSHVGSLGGLMAIKKGVCHMAGSHLLDIEDGSYNVSYIKKYLPGRGVKLVNLVYRQQGLIIPKGNPKAIVAIGDLARKGIGMINRQAGSGTRILLDYRLDQLGIDPAGLAGYGNEEFT
ncbi:MAG: molybdopterin biosynthesis protein, partial [Desulfobacterales bacterium]|nr:molybdopterin biosynthesis protein [Desulfobacterales bacterium]